MARTLLLILVSGLVWGPQVVSAQVRRNEALMGESVRVAGLQPAWLTRLRVAGSGRVSSMVQIGPTLFVQTTTATLEAVDAETGRTLWTTQTGNSRFPSVTATANDHYVAVANGTRLYVLDRASGQLSWDVELAGGTPSSGGAMTADHVYIPMLSGALESYKLIRKNAVDRAPVIYYGQGAAEAPPITSAKHLMWGTNAGSVYIDGLETSLNRVRFVSNGPIVSPLAYRPPRIFVASEDTYVYALDDTTGTKLWQFPAGSPVRQPPVSIEGAVYVIADAGGLSRLAADTGLEQWYVPNVRKFLAASPTRIYVADVASRLLVLDAARGAVLAVLPIESMDFRFTNTQTDRIYLGTTSGLLECLREPALVQPISHIPPPPKEGKAGPVKKKAAEEATEGEKPAEDAAKAAADPFAK